MSQKSKNRKLNNPELEPLLEKAKDYAIAFRNGLEDRPPRATATTQELRAPFIGDLAEGGTAAGDVIDQLAAAADPGLMAVPGPNFFGWVMGASHPVGVAADWMTSAWGQNCANEIVAPAAAMAEEVAGAWLLDVLDLPRQASVGFVTGATLANFVGLAAARSEVLRRIGYDVEADGLFGAPKKVAVFIGEDAHATVFSALQFLGIGSANVVKIPVDENGAMRADVLREMVSACFNPKIIVAQAGQINTGAFDPFEEIAEIASEHDAWVHVDGAFGLWARASKDRAHLARGLDKADSWATDGHKWLQIPYDCGYVIVKDAEAHRRAMSIAASYLPTTEDDRRDPADYVPELSRRARGFATWAVLKHLGRDGIDQLVTRHCELARRLRDRLDTVPGIEILNDVNLNQLAVGFGAGKTPDEQNKLAEDMLDLMRDQNEFVLGGAQWHGRWIMRISIISEPTRELHIDALADAIIANWEQLN